MKTRRLTVAEFADVYSGGTPSTTNPNYWDGEMAWVTPKDMSLRSDVYISRGERSITEQGLRESSACLIPANTVILSSRAPVGYVAISKNLLSTNQGCKNLVCKEEVAHPKFIYYLLKISTEKLKAHATGSTYTELSTSRLKNISFDLPENLEIQIKIASTLSAYDDLIENNRRRIQLLEQAARLLYKEWFVHLRFPGHEHTTITNGIPEGWEKKTYSDLFKFLGGFAFKSKTYQTEGKLGIVTIKNVHDARFITECRSRLNAVPETMKEYCALDTGDILLSLTGNVGRACIVFGENYLLNQRVAKVVSNRAIPRSFTYWTFSNDTTQKELENLAYGVAQLNLSPVKLGEREFVKPSSMLLELFEEIADPMFQQITTLNLKTSRLIQARDLLLPRLMNESISV